MGFQSLFDGTANFSSILECKNQTLITIIEHKAKIEVDELGTTAAAATAMEIMIASAPREPSIKFNCDHPFIFLIHDAKFNEILFAGIYRDPK